MPDNSTTMTGRERIAHSLATASRAAEGELMSDRIQEIRDRLEDYLTLLLLDGEPIWHYSVGLTFIAHAPADIDTLVAALAVQSERAEKAEAALKEIADGHDDFYSQALARKYFEERQ